MAVAEREAFIEEIDHKVYRGDVIAIVRRADHPSKPRPLFGPPDEKPAVPNTMNICRQCNKFPQAGNAVDGQLCTFCNSAASIDYGDGDSRTVLQFRVGNQLVQADDPLYITLLVRVMCDEAVKRDEGLKPLGEILKDFVDRYAVIPVEYRARRFILKLLRDSKPESFLAHGAPLAYRGGEVVDATDHDVIVNDLKAEVKALQSSYDAPLSLVESHIDKHRMQALERVAHAAATLVLHGEVGGSQRMWARHQELKDRLDELDGKKKAKELGMTSRLEQSLKSTGEFWANLKDQKTGVSITGRQVVAGLCAHPDIEYRVQHDNYYCTSCQEGMGTPYFRVARDLNLLRKQQVNFEELIAKATALRDKWLEEGLNGDLTDQLGALDTILKLIEGRP